MKEYEKMECKKCSAVNPEEAVFCRNCGKRLDGKVSCPACDAMNDEDSDRKSVV